MIFLSSIPEKRSRQISNDHLSILSGMEVSVKNHTDMLIFHTAICAGASQIAPDGRHELDIRVATPSLRSGMEE